MTLLDDLMSTALDPAYADAAARRAARAGRLAADRSVSTDGGHRIPWGERHLPVAAGLLLLALIVALAAGQHRHSAPDAAKARAALAAEVTRRTAELDSLTRTAEQLRTETATLRAQVLSATNTGDALARHLADLETATGLAPLRGPGVTVKVADAAPPADGSGTIPDESRVHDVDLQAIVNALWADGAEAIAVNGQRLDAQTAIRAAGEAILVDFHPLLSPYAVVALGGPDLQTRFVDGDVARRFETWTQAYGIGFDVLASRSLTVPGAAPAALRDARPTRGSTPP